MSFRIGHGYDVHAFCSGNGLVLGGVKIPFTQSLKAHSDGDVVIHALCDALLGALALGDIGMLFPDTDSQYKNINSAHLLHKTYSIVCERGWVLCNADITVIAEEPKLSPHKLVMRQSLAQVLQVALEDISIKATTSESLGFTGRKEGIATHAVVLLQKASTKSVL
jgi:2-C-methyl-D-erythritol 2,4-cyclodiphosphate synthase